MALNYLTFVTMVAEWLLATHTYISMTRIT